MISVLLVDDHEMVLESFRRMLDAEDGIWVVATATTGAEAVRAALAHVPDVIVLDYLLPDTDGVEVARRLRSSLPDARIVLITGSGIEGVVVDSLACGCVGFVNKTAALSTLASAVRSAAAGELTVSARAFVGRGASRDSVASLTLREREVLCMLADGLTNGAIADRLVLSTNTVRTHVQTLLAKLNAHSRLEAVAVGRRRGLLST